MGIRGLKYFLTQHFGNAAYLNWQYIKLLTLASNLKILKWLTDTVINKLIYWSSRAFVFHVHKKEISFPENIVLMWHLGIKCSKHVQLALKGFRNNVLLLRKCSKDITLPEFTNKFILNVLWAAYLGMFVYSLQATPVLLLSPPKNHCK